MSRAFADISFTPSVKAAQSFYGSRDANLGFELSPDPRHTLTEPEMAFIRERDSLYMATVSETSWPYVQHRGGQAGFIKVLDDRTIGFADFRGNRQYISVGNINADGRTSLILMDYPSRRRLKLWGRARIVHESEAPELIAALEDPTYRARIERGILIRIEAIEWNCPQHITPRYTEQEIERLIEPVLQENRALKMQQTKPRPSQLGDGELSLQVTAVRQLTPSIQLYRLEQAQRQALPLVTPGSHLKLPWLRDDGQLDHRCYSICQASSDGEYYEIAVQRQDDGKGGSKAIHQQYQLGLQLGVERAGNYFSLHTDARPAVLIAAGIGITPLIAMLRDRVAKQLPVQLHYAGRSLASMAFQQELRREFGALVQLYDASQGQRLSLTQLLSDAPADAEFYLCGPQKLLDEAQHVAATLQLAPQRIHSERFSVATSATDQPFQVTLARSQQVIEVGAAQTLLDALLDQGIAAPSECRVGDCGQCAVKMLAGAAEHRDHVLTDRDKAAGLICTCVSRARGGAITLDI